MKLILAVIIISCILASFQGCAASPQIAINSMVSTNCSDCKHVDHYEYRGPYQFALGEGK